MMENSNSIEEEIVNLIKEKEFKKLIDKAIDDRISAIEFTNIDSLSFFPDTYSKIYKIWDGILYYSLDAKTWNEWNGSKITSNKDKKIYLRGLGNSRICNRVDFRNTFVITGNNVECNGNIENLLDYQVVARGEHPQMADYCYWCMFEGCTSLVKAPELPATTLANYCYESMFYNCTSLTEAPELPATTLAEYCCSGMFSGCTSLIKAPSILPATVLAKACYYGMFDGCTSLTEAPELPATTLAEYCYRNMFNGCTSLKLSTTQTDEYNIPYRIPTTGTGTTATRALESMFSGTGGTFTGTPTINTTYYLAS